MATLIIKHLILPIVKEKIEKKVKDFIKEKITNIFSSVFTDILINGGETLDNTTPAYLDELDNTNCEPIINGTLTKYEEILKNDNKQEELEKKKNHVFYIIVTQLLFNDYSQIKIGFDKEKEIVNKFFNYLLENDEKITEMLNITQLASTFKKILNKLNKTDKIDNKVNNKCDAFDFKCYKELVTEKLTDIFINKFKIDFSFNNPVLKCIIKNRPEYILINELQNQLKYVLEDKNCDNIDDKIKNMINNIKKNIEEIIKNQKHPSNKQQSIPNIGFFSKNPIDTILDKIEFKKNMKIILTNLCKYNNETDISKKDTLKETLNKSVKLFLEKIVDEIMELTNKLKNKYELLDDNELMYYEKYMKYKTKYLELKQEL